MSRGSDGFFVDYFLGFEVKLADPELHDERQTARCRAFEVNNQFTFQNENRFCYLLHT